MCIAIPSRIVALHGMTARIDVQGAQREVSIMLLPDPPQVGDFVLVHAGFAIQRLDPESGQETLQLFEDILRHEIDRDEGHA